MTQIITPQELKEQSLVDINVLDFYCDQAIKISQEVNLCKLIGQSLYDVIIAKIDDNTLSGKYAILVDDYIKDYLYLDSTAEIQIPLAFKNRNMGVVRTTDPEVESVELKDITYIKKYYSDRADFYAQKIVNYIRKNSADFPEYHTEDCNEIKPQDSSFRLNIF